MFLLFARVSLAQVVTFDVGSQSTYGVSVLRKGLIGFEAELDTINNGGRGGSPIEESIKPFLLIVRNESPTALVRLVVRCVLEYENGSPVVLTHTMVYGATNPAERIEQGQSIALIPGIMRAGPGYAAGDPDQLRELSRYWLYTQGTAEGWLRGYPNNFTAVLLSQKREILRAFD